MNQESTMIGVGLRPSHYPELEVNSEIKVDWFEAISENKKFDNKLYCLDVNWIYSEIVILSFTQSLIERSDNFNFVDNCESVIPIDFRDIFMK
jgi:hypothetical protein